MKMGQGAPFCSPFVILQLSHYPFIVRSELSLIISTKGPAPSSASPIYLKGQCHEIIDINIFSLISFPQAPESTIRAVWNFYRWQICHRYQQHQRSWRQNLPPVSLIPVVHLDLKISPRIFEKFRNDPNVISRGLGEDNS
jgi:hypothetical protein